MSSLLQTNEQSFDDFFLQKKIEFLMDANNKKIAKEMTNLQSMISQLHDEIKELKKNGPVHVEAAAPVQAFVQPVQPVAPQPLPQQVTPPKPASDVRPRYGDYTSDDVSIEKFFNYGSGRKR